MFKYTVLFLFIGLSYADDKNSGYIVTCPAIQICKVADSPTQNRAYAKINQENGNVTFKCVNHEQIIEAIDLFNA